MENLVAKIGLLLFLLVSPFAKQTIAQKQVEVVLDYKTYHIEGQGALVDLQFQYIGYTLKHIHDSLGMHAVVGIQTVIKDVSGKAVKDMAYSLNSPIAIDSVITDFYDVQQFLLPSGNYTAEVVIMDMNTKNPPITGAISLVVPDREGRVEFSDILIAEHAKPSEVVSPMNKSGYEILPRLSNFFGPDDVAIPYYVELYNANLLAEPIVGVLQRIVDEKGNEVQGFTKVARLDAKTTIPYFRNLDIRNLPSGSYKLEISVLDKVSMKPTNVKTGYFFDRINELEMSVDIENIVLDPNFQNSIADDSVGFYLASLLPIAKMSETKNIISILKSKDREMARKHMQQFWVVTSGAKAYDSWMEYKKNVQLVQKLYATNIKDGFETDRGRVYLQYGPPSQITIRESSPSEFPYELWQYDAIKVYRNRRFVFYNPDLVNNNYSLLHSDMVGELQNKNWQQQINRTNPGGDIDGTTSPSIQGSNSGVYYKQF